MAFCKPTMSASYSIVLLVHSNSKRLEIRCFLCRGFTKTQPSLGPSCVFEPLKNEVQTPYVQEIHPTLVLLRLLSILQRSFVLVGLGMSSNCVSSGNGEG